MVFSGTGAVEPELCEAVMAAQSVVAVQHERIRMKPALRHQMQSGDGGRVSRYQAGLYEFRQVLFNGIKPGLTGVTVTTPADERMPDDGTGASGFQRLQRSDDVR